MFECLTTHSILTSAHYFGNWCSLTSHIVLAWFFFFFNSAWQVSPYKHILQFTTANRYRLVPTYTTTPWAHLSYVTSWHEPDTDWAPLSNSSLPAPRQKPVHFRSFPPFSSGCMRQMVIIMNLDWHSAEMLCYDQCLFATTAS